MKETSGGSIMVTRSLFQEGEGGSIPTSPHQLTVQKCEFSDIIHIFEKYHYKGGHMGGGISFCLALMFHDTPVGGAVVGLPRHTSKYKNSLEIRRMALYDECPKNSESYFLSKIIWYIKKNTDARGVLSYADTSVGHKGTIYKAANFKNIGETAPSKHLFWQGKRYHPRSLTIDRSYSVKIRKALENGCATLETGSPKIIYYYALSPRL